MIDDSREMSWKKTEPFEPGDDRWFSGDELEEDRTFRTEKKATMESCLYASMMATTMVNDHDDGDDHGYNYDESVFGWPTVWPLVFAANPLKS